ncbi:MAG: adenine deaminase [Clostridiales bacterium]|nr:adenine deaminase [Clostridiales bacterium]MDD7387527.1 adenine deaminase [Bacillota bacterium]MDY6041200.1 adenine deaminase [Candidatus Faecousia sp.]
MSYTETWSGKINRKLIKKLHIIDVAAGREKADLVLKNATYVNVFSGELETCDIAVAEGLIVGLGSYSGVAEVDMTGKIVCPGFIDAHIHLESSLVSPSEFVRAVIPHGTTTVITDPHEITNVMGTDGIDYMLAATEGLPMDTMFMIPSCVPASPLDESGANLDYRDIDSFFEHPRVLGLAEMMNYPGIISADSDTVAKIVASQAHHKKIDGHAPGLTGYDLNAYVAAGVYSDHECATAEDAMRKLRLGQFIMVRDGTAARNLEALMPLIKSPKYFSRCMFCTDDKHPSDLLEKGHIDYICREAVRMGADPIQTVQVACLHAARYFLLNNRGAIAPGYLADFAVVEDLKDFHVVTVYKRGKLVYDQGQVHDFPKPEIPAHLNAKAHDTFHLPVLRAADFAETRSKVVIGMIDGQIITEDLGYANAINLEEDILKMAVVERHKNTRHIGIGYLHGYGLKEGAVATSVSHDSHNIICVGCNDADCAFAVNRIAENKGGIVVVNHGQVIAELPLEIAGLMSDKPLVEVNDLLEKAKAAAHAQGVGNGIDPFMTLSFMALPVIPTVRLTTRGVIDVATQQYI